MSTDFAFWRGTTDADPKQTYLKLCEGEHVDGLEPVDRDKILAAFENGLAGWDRVHETTWVHGADEDGNGPGMQLEVGEQVIFTTSTGLGPEELNEIIDVMIAMDYPLYDPQIDERF